MGDDVPKRQLRREILKRRRMLSETERQRLSLLAQRHLLEHPLWQTPGAVGLYSPVCGEVDTELLCREAWRQQRPVVFPRVRGELLEFVETDPHSPWSVGAFGVREPAGDRVVHPAELGLLIMPGVVFDRDGHRLGYGRGYYDRALAGCAARPVRVGLAFGFQLVARVPRAAHDIQLHYLATENGVVALPATPQEGTGEPPLPKEDWRIKP
ncbi:MAG: 5-formyltetrahydrofolate cyclo-ligase [Deltaproteobacteria bacterium]|nr:MAG: 5-formyltetrahydrofolate cyclo-ligase [Deltaproteobacteria bacterium]